MRLDEPPASRQRFERLTKPPDRWQGGQAGGLIDLIARAVEPGRHDAVDSSPAATGGGSVRVWDRVMDIDLDIPDGQLFFGESRRR